MQSPPLQRWGRCRPFIFLCLHTDHQEHPVSPMSASSLFAADSVFTVDIRANDAIREEVQVGPVNRPPNNQSFDVAIIEFRDDGTLTAPNQLKAAADCIEHARRSNPNGAVVVLFIHGWHHSARWNLKTGEGDTHFQAFRAVLQNLALREAERYMPEPAGRRVVGIYLGWNGDPKAKLFNWVRWASFWNRYRTAQAIGGNEPFRKAVQTVVARTKDPLDNSLPLSESPLILIGHSMGALMLESAFLSLLQAEDQPLIREQPAHTESCVEIQRDGKPVSFPDVLLALNSAADSQIARSIIAALHGQKFSKTVSAEGIRYAPPLLVSLTSTADKATGRIWRFAQGWHFRRRTDGHDPTLFTHSFDMEDPEVSCPPKGFIDFGQNWHCLRRPMPPETPTPSFAIDLPARNRRDLSDASEYRHARYRLMPLSDGASGHLAWIFQVSPEIIADHNDIFGFKSSSLILALIQISGATMSLAEEWERNFEEENP